MKYKFKLDTESGAMEFKEFASALTFKCLEIDTLNFRLFTGKIDRNGKEVYEGDRVRIQDKIYTVKYDINYMSFVFAFGEGSWFVKDFGEWEIDKMEIVQ